MNTSVTVTVRPTTFSPKRITGDSHIIEVVTREEMFMFVQGPHIIGQSAAITAMNLTTSLMKFFVNTTHSESKICV